MNRALAMQWRRLERLPLVAWAAMGVAAIALVVAFALSPQAAILMALAAAACFWAAREARRFIIAPRVADQAGLTLGRPLSIEESNPMGPPRPLARMAMAEAVPIESGSFTVTVALTLRFGIVG